MWSWQPNDRMWFWLDGIESCCVGVEGSSKSICVRRFSPSALSLFRFHLSPFPPETPDTQATFWAFKWIATVVAYDKVDTLSDYVFGPEINLLIKFPQQDILWSSFENKASVATKKSCWSQKKKSLADPHVKSTAWNSESKTVLDKLTRGQEELFHCMRNKEQRSRQKKEGTISLTTVIF